MPFLLLFKKLFLNPTSLGLILFGLLVFGNYYQYNKINNLQDTIADKKKENDELVANYAHSMDVIQQNDRDCQDLLLKTKERVITIVKHKKTFVESMNVDLDYKIPDEYLTTINETIAK